MIALRKIQGRVRIAGIGLVALSLFIASCGSDSNESEFEIVVSTSMIADILANVVGEDAPIEVLVPVGSDPHDYQPSSQQVASINRASLVVVNGLGLEEGLADTLSIAAEDGANVLEIAPLLEPISFAETDALDPHFWMDPLRVARAADQIGAAFDQVTGETAGAEGAAEYSAQLEQTHGEIVDLLDSVGPSARKLVTNHDSMGYFAVRYGFKIVGTVVPGGATLSEPSSKELAELVAVMRTENVDVLFAETTHPTVLADAVAAELDGEVEVVELFTGSLGEPGTDADTLIGMLLANARLISGALG